MIKTMKRTIPVLLLAVQLVQGQDYQLKMSGFSAMHNNVSYSLGWWDPWGCRLLLRVLAQVMV